MPQWFAVTGALLTGFLACSSPQKIQNSRELASFGAAEGDSCSYSKICPDGRSAGWAQQRVNGDLMLAFLQEKRVPSRVSIAVVDSGFDEHGNRSLLASPKFSTARGIPAAGDPSRDEVGHGTAVSGLIGAASPIGLAPNLPLTSYRVVKAGSEGSTESSFLTSGIEKACVDGNEIINVSWGNAIDENDILSFEKTNASLLKRLEEKGCLVIAAAGNGSIRISRKDVQVDDNYLRVEAIAPSGERAYFTSNGEVLAPGQGVFTLRSTQDSPPATENSCGKAPGQFINGTSFAAPITAALAGQVLNYLKTSPRFQELPPGHRLQMVTRILRASQSISGHVDGYLAVRIAESWMRSGGQLVDAEALPELLSDERRQACSTGESLRCRNQWECPKKKACLTEARRLLSICGNTPGTGLVQDMMRAGFDMGAFELTLQTMRFAAREGKSVPSIELQRKLMAREAWKYQFQRWSTKSLDYLGRPHADSTQRSMSFDIAAALLPHLLIRGYVGEPSDANRALPAFLSSAQFYRRLSAPERNGSIEDLELVRNVIARSYESLGPQETLKILREGARLANQAIVSDRGGAFAESISWLRLMSRLRRDEALPGLRAALATMETSLMRRFVERRLESIPGRQESELMRPFFAERASELTGLKTKLLSGAAHPEDYRTPLGIFLARDEKLHPRERLAYVLRGLEHFAGALKEDDGADLLRALSREVIELARSSQGMLEAETREDALSRWWSIGRTRAKSLSLKYLMIDSANSYSLELVFDAPRLAQEYVSLAEETAQLPAPDRMAILPYFSNLLSRAAGPIISNERGATAIGEILRGVASALRSLGASDPASGVKAHVGLSVLERALSHKQVLARIQSEAPTRQALLLLRSAIQSRSLPALTASQQAKLSDLLAPL